MIVYNFLSNYANKITQPSLMSHNTQCKGLRSDGSGAVPIPDLLILFKNNILSDQDGEESRDIKSLMKIKELLVGFEAITAVPLYQGSIFQQKLIYIYIARKSVRKAF